MPPFPIHCYTEDCDGLAEYKIAAGWMYGTTGELKTYGLCCRKCLKEWLAAARRKHTTYQLASEESVELPGIYRLVRGRRDLQLDRLPELEKEVSQGQ